MSNPNSVTVSQVSDVTTVEITTQGPQGPAISGVNFDISLTDTQTATFTPSILFYDVLLTEPGGSKNYYLEGKLFISEGYTA